jgi:hypothetical protein
MHFFFQIKHHTPCTLKHVVAHKQPPTEKHFYSALFALITSEKHAAVPRKTIFAQQKHEALERRRIFGKQYTSAACFI